MCFTRFERFLAVAHRLDCKDYIGVYSTSPWTELTKFRCKTADLASIYWLSGSAALIALDTHLFYKFLVYNLSGEVCY